MANWNNIKEKPPKYGEIVWGFWENIYVALVCHYLSRQEIEYGMLEKLIWHNLNDRKIGFIRYWTPIIVPEIPIFKLEEQKGIHKTCQVCGCDVEAFNINESDPIVCSVCY